MREDSRVYNNGIIIKIHHSSDDMIRKNMARKKISKTKKANMIKENNKTRRCIPRKVSRRQKCAIAESALIPLAKMILPGVLNTLGSAMLSQRSRGKSGVFDRARYGF